jgi:hypothetical protein
MGGVAVKVEASITDKDKRVCICLGGIIAEIVIHVKRNKF